MRILLASSEMSPLARSGGLGDAVAGLAAALAAAGHDVTVALPLWRHIDDRGSEGGEAGPAEIRHRAVGDVRVALVDDPAAFDRPGMYGPDPKTPWDDAWWQWGRFALAIASMAPEYDVVHLHDAHAGAAALITKPPTVFTIHNAAYPILGPLHDTADLLGLGPAATVPAGTLEWYGSASYLKAGLVGADRVTTVSPSFAAQLAGDENSFGLGPVVRALENPLTGVLNGIDTVEWDPENDRFLPATFGPDTIRDRLKVRKALLKRFGLDDGVVFGNVGRMTSQKGIGLLDPIIDALVDEGLRFVAVGGGELDDVVDGWAQRHPRAVAHAEFGDEAARLIFGGADAYLMPSEFEPCGLGQMYALRYGCPPVVRFTGGLADTVVDVDIDPGTGNGFGFVPFTSDELAKTIRRAMRYHRALPGLWHDLQLRGMAADLSWDRAAREYVRLYREAGA